MSYPTPLDIPDLTCLFKGGAVPTGDDFSELIASCYNYELSASGGVDWYTILTQNSSYWNNSTTFVVNNSANLVSSNQPIVNNLTNIGILSTNQLIMSSLSGIIGVQDGSYASTGFVGETNLAIVLSSFPVSLASTVSKVITSFTLGAGDWKLTAVVHYLATNASVSSFQTFYNTTSAFASNNPFQFSSAPVYISNLNVPYTIDMSFARTSITIPQTYYLVCTATFGNGTVSAWGGLEAVRIR